MGKLKELRISLDEKDFEVLVRGGILGIPAKYFEKYGHTVTHDVKIALKDIGIRPMLHHVGRGGTEPLRSNETYWKQLDD
jgi:hypothetical protein